jgi:CRP-like cAMP-binding protein
VSIHTLFAPTPGNQLLASLPAESLSRLRPQMDPAELRLRDTLWNAGDSIPRVYFPLEGWVSMLAPLESGDVAEVGLIGNEGMVGLPLALGATHDNLEAMVQGEGTALTLRADRFAEALGSDAALRAPILRYAHAHLLQVSRTAACNVHHHVEQRLARWLLMSHDRAQSDTFVMTHEFLGMMLSVRRAGISVAAGALQKAGLIHYERGTITITDRPGLEQASCECYSIVRRAFEPQMGGDARPPPPTRA